MKSQIKARLITFCYRHWSARRWPARRKRCSRALTITSAGAEELGVSGMAIARAKDATLLSMKDASVLADGGLARRAPLPPAAQPAPADGGFIRRTPSTWKARCQVGRGLPRNTSRAFSSSTSTHARAYGARHAD